MKKKKMLHDDCKTYILGGALFFIIGKEGFTEDFHRIYKFDDEQHKMISYICEQIKLLDYNEKKHLIPALFH